MDGRFPTVSEIDRRCPLIALQVERYRGHLKRGGQRVARQQRQHHEPQNEAGKVATHDQYSSFNVISSL